ncbi:TPA: hypothetical protein PC505_003927 [Morganella morganii]|nr:hypothetical protein [Morganella morganii]HDF2424472.1 hypothetical protein [Morganella morganii]
MILKKIMAAGLFLIPLSLYAKVLVVGDSLAYPIAESMKTVMPVDGLYLESTGLKNPGKLNWPDYIRSVDISGYSNIIISLGANDGITEREIETYQQKATGLIRLLSDRNENALITWILPPVMKDERKEKSLTLTRIAINRACNATGAICFNPAVVIGSEYSDKLGGVMVRSQDGIHYTIKGADLIVSRLLDVCGAWGVEHE